MGKLNVKSALCCGITMCFMLSALAVTNCFERLMESLSGFTYYSNGNEELLLRPDKTYVQSLTSPTRQFTTRGTWKSTYMFLDGTEGELAGANLSEGESTERYGNVHLQAHRENGKLKLARNESADWYYERVQ